MTFHYQRKRGLSWIEYSSEYRERINIHICCRVNVCTQTIFSQCVKNVKSILDFSFVFSAQLLIWLGDSGSQIVFWQGPYSSAVITFVGRWKVVELQTRLPWALKWSLICSYISKLEVFSDPPWQRIEWIYDAWETRNEREKKKVQDLERAV
jgi:hypothetical protein